MKSFAILAAVGATAVAAQKTPTAPAPAGCATNYPGSFEISVTNVSSTSTKRDLSKRVALTATLTDGVLTDAENRTGSVVANYQFQFDNPIQVDALYTSGWSVCENGTLAIGGSAIFYQCLSGNFYNLYERSTGDQCTPIYINVISTGTTVSAASDGQATAASATGALTQISDGQLQGATTTAPVVSQITDGQIQASTGVQVVSQISDGQLQLTTATAAVVSQISDGQIQATTGAVVTQISDGQIQATTAAGAVVTQISDGQIQATTGAVVSQISDGQIQATAGTGLATSARNATTPTVAAVSPTISSFTGAAAQATAGFFGLAAGALALAML